MKLERFIDSVLRRQSEVVYVEEIPPSEACFSQPEKPLPPALQRALRSMGIHQLYSHQVEALNNIRAGRHTVIVTGTASGKTLCYNLPVVEQILSGGEPRALYLFPTKALAQDQLKTLLKFPKAEPEIDFRSGTYDGDTPPDLRRRMRDMGHIILSNPDMLHQGVLPNHPKWANFFSNLRFVVLDEVHTYRGVFGSNVANVIRRLKRIAAHYGSRPVFVACSATINNPVELASQLIGEDVVPVIRDGSPRGPKSFVFLNPGKLDEKGLARRGPHGTARKWMSELVKRRVQTIAFSRTRLASEVIYRYCRETLQSRHPTLAGTVRAYRGGYLPEERREIERGIAEGKILGISSTNALELGIDIGSLEACLIVGYPGTIASLWQQAGRAGRGTGKSLVVLIAYNSPIDQYLMNNPRYVLDKNPENAVIDPDNPHLMLYHLRCAAQEMPLDPPAVVKFGRSARALLDMLVESGDLSRVKRKYYWTGRGYPAADLGLRNLSNAIYTIQESGTQRIIGTIDEESAFLQVHREAVYLHGGETYFVEDLDIVKKVAFVQKKDLDYFTQAVPESNIVIDEVETERGLKKSTLGLGSVTVTSLIPLFKKIKFGSRESIGFGRIDLPPQKLETHAVWLVPPAKAVERLMQFGRTPVDALAGIANVFTDIARLHIMSDPSDMGTVVDASNFGSSTLFVYDRHQGGMGFAQRAFKVCERILEDVLVVIRSCSCEEGCPSCVGAPLPHASQTSMDGGTLGVIPDKEAALVMLHGILEKEPYTPKHPRKFPPSLGPPRKEDESPGSEDNDIHKPAEALPFHLEQQIRSRLSELNRKGKT